MTTIPRAFPKILDNTIVTAFKACHRKMELEYIYNFSGPESIHLIAGRAFAAACETTRIAFYGEEETPLIALAKGTRTLIREYRDIDIILHADDPGSKLYVKSFDRLLDAFLAYFGMIDLPMRCDTTGAHPLGTDPYPPIIYEGTDNAKETGAEFSAVIPIGITHPETGDDLLYSIRFDALCETPYGIMGMDEKTGKTKSNNWSDQWQLRSQFLNYIKVGQMSGIPELTGMITRGIILQKTQFHFPEAIILPPQSVIDRCWNDTLHYIEIMKLYYERGYFPSDFSDACSSFVGCPFREICESDDPESIYPTLDRYAWDPSTATRTPLSLIDIGTMEEADSKPGCI